LRRRAAHRLDTEAGVDQRITEAGQRGAGRGREKARPAASINTHTSATFAPPSLSGT
jgi:hypothetical protein